MTAEVVFTKALSVLDRADYVRGEELLRDALTQASNENKPYIVGQAMCCLGDLLYQLGRLEESESILNAFIALETQDDVLDIERQRAVELLESIKSERGF